MEHKKFITVHKTFWLKNRTFKVNEQFCIKDKVVQKKWCSGCQKYKDVVYYLIDVEGSSYMVKHDYVVESDDEIACEDQNFQENRLRNIGNLDVDYDIERQNNDSDQIWSDSQNIPM